MIIPLDVYVDGVFMDRVQVRRDAEIRETRDEWSVLGEVTLAHAPRVFLTEMLDKPRPFAQAHVLLS